MPFDVTLGVSTDVAVWFVFHPDDLSHRATHPSAWWNSDFAIRKEFAAGNLIAVATGGDGYFFVRFTDGPLSAREIDYSRCTAQFRLHVRHNRLFLGEDCHLPNGDLWRQEEYHSDGWLEIPNGMYAVTIHGMARAEQPDSTDERGSRAPNSQCTYVAHFERVSDASLLPVAPRELPSLDLLPPATYTPNRPSPPSDQLPVLVMLDQVPFPGVPCKLAITPEQHGLLESWTRARNHMLRWHVLIVPHPHASQGVRFEVGHFGSAFDLGRPFDFEAPERFELGGEGVALEPVALEPQVEAGATHTASELAAALIHAKASFARHAATSQSYRQTVKFGAFRAEWVESIDDPDLASNAMAHYLEAAPDTKWTWVHMPTLERLNAISSWIAACS